MTKRQNRWTAAIAALAALTVFTVAPATAASQAATPTQTSATQCRPITVRGQAACLEIASTQGPTLTPGQRAAKIAGINSRISKAYAAEPAASRPQTPGSFPANCAGAVIPNVVTYPDRFDSCSAATYTAYIVSGTTIVGAVPLTVLQWTSDYSAKFLSPGTWAHGVDVTVGTLTGLAAPGVQLSFDSLCDGASSSLCTVQSTSGTQPAIYTTGSETTVIYTETDAGPSNAGNNAVTTDTSHLGILWTFVYNNTSTWDDNGTLYSTGNGLANRCDSYTGIYSGSNALAVACVDEQYTPTVIYSAITNPPVSDVANHIYSAQASLPSHWGVPSYGNYLTRATSNTIQINNNTAACAGVLPSCDEFPLASTYQGASFTPVGDWSAVTVSSTSNSSQGGITGAFYTLNRIIDGHKFWVKAVLTNGSASW